MTSLSESRLLQSILPVAASVVLVCGALVLLTSTSPWSPRDEAGAPSPAATPAGAQKTSAASEPEMRQPSEAAAKTKEDAGGAQVEQTSPGRNEPVATELNASETASPVAASDMPQLPTLQGADTEAIDTESMVASDATDGSAEPPVQTGASPDAVAGGEPETAVAAKPATVATDETSASLKESQPPAIAARTVDEDPGTVGDLPTPAAAPDKANGPSKTATAEISASVPLPPPPLPKRKPKAQSLNSVEITHAAPPPQRPSRSDASKRDQPRPAVAQQAAAQPGNGRWLPMALAPADKPLPAQPVRLSGAAYASKVWTALARHKPRAGQNGSATVVFSIGAGGGLDGVTIGTSSGIARLDQLALATVRSAAPFPPPPSGVASFSIRIDFQ